MSGNYSNKLQELIWVGQNMKWIPYRKQSYLALLSIYPPFLLSPGFKTKRKLLNVNYNGIFSKKIVTHLFHFEFIINFTQCQQIYSSRRWIYYVLACDIIFVQCASRRWKTRVRQTSRIKFPNIYHIKVQ